MSTIASALQACITYPAPLRATPVRSDMLRDSRCVGTDVHTHERGTYARRGKPCRRGAVFGRATSSRCVGAQVHTPERGACLPRLQGSSPCSLSNAKMSTMHQHCEHALLTPRPFGPWKYCRLTLLNLYCKNVNNASALRACITYSAPPRALGVL